MKINNKLLLEIAKKAGDAILEIYNTDFSHELKKDNFPLTKADMASHNIILKGLKESYPEIPILSEESSEIPYKKRKNWKKFWLVDPLDGTKEFIKKNGEFTVNIALIENNKPVSGIIYVPVKDVFYFTNKEKAYKQISNEQPIEIPLKNIPKQENKLKVVASKSHLNQETKDYIENLKKQNPDKEIETTSAGSSLKFCLIAEGLADIYPRLAPTAEWDTAAAHAIVNASGKRVFKFNSNEELIYNKQNLLNPYFVVK